MPYCLYFRWRILAWRPWPGTTVFLLRLLWPQHFLLVAFLPMRAWFLFTRLTAIVWIPCNREPAILAFNRHMYGCLLSARCLAFWGGGGLGVEPPPGLNLPLACGVRDLSARTWPWLSWCSCRCFLVRSGELDFLCLCFLCLLDRECFRLTGDGSSAGLLSRDDRALLLSLPP